MAKAKASNKPMMKNQWVIAGVVIVIIVVVLALLISPVKDLVPTDACKEEVYFETVIEQQVVTEAIPFNYELKDSWESVVIDYPYYGTIARFSRTIANLDTQGGTFSISCIFETPEDGRVTKTDSMQISAGTNQALYADLEISPGENVEFFGCTITAPTVVKEVTKDVEKQVQKTRLPAGCE